MIRECVGDIFGADVEALVNPVNTVGVTGAGLARCFRDHYPAMSREYRSACARGDIKVGVVHPWSSRFAHSERPHWIISFPTKLHWRDPSRIEWIDDGLVSLRATVVRLGIGSIAVPALGCGLGGLDWGDVRELMWERLGNLPEVDVVLYPPKDHT